MSKMNKDSIPFVNLHAHSVAGSIFDAIGFPQDHMDFAYANGAEASGNWTNGVLEDGQTTQAPPPTTE